MVVGALFCRQIAWLDAAAQGMLTPVFIFSMLFITFCRVDARRIRFSWMHLWLLFFQIVASVGVYYSLAYFDIVVAQGAMICILAPVAMAAVVIGGMLGANLETMAAYSLLCNIAIALYAPLLLHAFGNGECTMAQILQKVSPLLIAPFVAGQFCRFCLRRVSDWVSAHGYLSFYIWLLSLIVIIGRTTCFLLDQTQASLSTEIILALVALITINKSKYLYALTVARLLLCLVSDTFLVSTLPISANLGVNGIGYSNIIVNALLLAVSLMLLAKESIKVFAKAKLDFAWTKEFVKIGGISGVESLVRNVAYMVMISRMVNFVGEQGTYWVANNFIWGWLLLPVLQLGELIKQETAADKENVRKNTLGYFGITAIVSVLWCASIPLWKPFMTNVLQFTDVDKLFELVLVLLGFYVLYAIQNVFDSVFYGLGKTNYMLFESVVTNTIYYGIAFVLYATGVWTPTLIGIALLFGIGNAFDSIVSLGAFAFLLKKEKINILNVE